MKHLLLSRGPSYYLELCIAMAYIYWKITYILDIKIDSLENSNYFKSSTSSLHWTVERKGFHSKLIYVFEMRKNLRLFPLWKYVEVKRAELPFCKKKSHGLARLQKDSFYLCLWCCNGSDLKKKQKKKNWPHKKQQQKTKTRDIFMSLKKKLIGI